MDSLDDCMTLSDVKKALRNLPTELTTVYDGALQRIRKMAKKRYRYEVLKLLSWIAWAERPLHVSALEHAMAISPGARSIDPDSILPIKRLASSSAGLIVIDRNQYLRLVHPSAGRYFTERRSGLFPNGDEQIAEASISYLQLEGLVPCTGNSQAATFQIRCEVYPFLSYAAFYWGLHAHRSKSSVLVYQITAFMRQNQHFSAAMEALWYLDNNTVSGESWDAQSSATPLHVAAYFGLADVVSCLIKECSDIDALDSLGTTPLMYACGTNGRAYPDIVKMLLDAGASAHYMCCRRTTALTRATKSGAIEAVEMLLQKENPNLNALDTSSSKHLSALMLASKAGRTDIMKLLLTRLDIDVNMRTVAPSGWTALIIAAAYRQSGAIEVLLAQPGIEIIDNKEQNAAMYAASSGCIDGVQMLVEAGVHVDILDGHAGTPLMRAVDYGNTKTVNRLIKLGANPLHKDFLNRGILHSAAINGQYGTLKYLLEANLDLDINAQGKDGRTPLHDAVRLSFPHCTKVLLDHGACVDIPDCSGMSPFEIAVQAGYIPIIEMVANGLRKVNNQSVNAKLISLIEKPLWQLVRSMSFQGLQERIRLSSPEYINDRGLDWEGSALHQACSRNRPEVVRLLLEAGADPNMQNAFRRTPLFWASEKNLYECAKLLVDHGADINLSPFPDSTVWENAVEFGADMIAILLIEKGASIPMTSPKLQIALSIAVTNNNLKAVEYLVAAGASIHCKFEGRTPIQLAEDSDLTEIMTFFSQQLLLGLQTPDRSVYASPKPSVNSSMEDGEQVDENNGVSNPILVRRWRCIDILGMAGNRIDYQSRRIIVMYIIAAMVLLVSAALGMARSSRLEAST
jgi:ankyrin repeat protein